MCDDVALLKRHDSRPPIRRLYRRGKINSEQIQEASSRAFQILKLHLLGAAPHLGIDPVVMAAQAITALQTIRSRTLSPLAPSVVTVGTIHGGTRFNIIPGEVALEGTVRTYDPAVQDTVERRMREILDGVTRAGGGSFELDYDRIVPVTINDPALTERSVPSLVDALGEDQVAVADPWMAGEDFSLFANEVPGFFYMLGTLAPGTTSGDHHSPTFRAGDGALPVGMRTMAYTVWDYLSDPTAP